MRNPTAEKIKQRRIWTLCEEELISDVFKIGAYWSIPADVKKPKDERIKSGKYINKRAVE